MTATPQRPEENDTAYANLAPIALTMGDPAGIGPEIALKAWLARKTHRLPPFLIYADPQMLADRAHACGIQVPLAILSDGRDSPRARDLFASALPVAPVALARPAQPGKPDAVNAPAVIKCIETATGDTARGDVRAVVTCPIAKSVLYEAGFAHPGHTEFLAALCPRYWPLSTPPHPVMMLASAALRVVPVTIHVPLRQVPSRLTSDLIAQTIRTTWDALRRDFGIARPRIAVAGLNPHAGEGGSIGREDLDLIAPCIAQLTAEGLSVSGPHPADTLFHAAARARYDAAVCMYHDQALIPIKTLAFDEGVNVTLGLPFVRTSPDHGTAFDIAAQGCADATSLVHSIKMADDMSRARLRCQRGSA